MGSERGGDPGVELSDPCPDGQELGGEVDHDAGRDILSGHHGVLSLRRAQSGCCDLLGAADLPLDQPGPQPRLPDPSDRRRGLVAGQQDQRATGVGVVEGPLQGREVAAEDIAEPVDHPDPIADQVGAMSHQQPQLGDQRGSDLHWGQVATVSQRLRDDVGVLGVGLGLAAVGTCHLVHGPSRHVPDPLAVRGRQCEQEPRHGAGDIDSPHDLLGAGQHAGDRIEDCCFVVDDLRRPQRGAGLIDQTQPVMALADIDACPRRRYLSLHHTSSSEPMNTCWPEGTPRRQVRKQRPERASQSAVRAPEEEPGGQSIGATTTAIKAQPHPALPGHPRTYGSGLSLGVVVRISVGADRGHWHRPRQTGAVPARGRPISIDLEPVEDRSTPRKQHAAATATCSRRPTASVRVPGLVERKG